MPTNDFIGFANSGSANIASQADYAAAAEQGIGMQPGPASSKLANKVWRQGANMAAALGKIAVSRGYDALDNGDIDALQANIDDSISTGTFNRMYFSQTSGTFTAPRSGIYRVTLKAGGGGGSGAYTSKKFGGGGGGEGGTLVFYTKLIKGNNYSYVIGAGGAAGENQASASAPEGGNGGASSFNAAYNISGGEGGKNAANASTGGVGGANATTPAGAEYYIIPGENGADGLDANSASEWIQSAAKGGGRSGSSKNGALSLFGSGGSGGGGYVGNAGYAPTAGAAGFILIEYAN